ncbi:MAG: hypothetical protein ACP5FH_06655 [Terracidiphilus sp.]
MKKIAGCIHADGTRSAAVARCGLGAPATDRETDANRCRVSGQTPDEAYDPGLEEALAEFRSSLCAWSEAVFQHSPTGPAVAPRRRFMQWALGWALVCLLIAGLASAGMWERRQQQQRVAVALRWAEHERMVAAQQAKRKKDAEENLLARINNDVSQEVPSAMEPLVRLMYGEETQ